MRVWANSRWLLDTVVEEVACRAGILLTDHDVKSMLKGTGMSAWRAVLDEPPENKIGVRPEFIEDFVRVVRVAIGNLPDATPGHFLMVRRLRRLHDHGIDPRPIYDALNAVIDSGKYTVIGQEAAKDISERSGSPLDVVNEVLLALGEMQDRSLWSRTIAQKWDGAVPLGQLFKAELLPSNPEVYLDQRFIDYLAANGEGLDRIHWRNFERLCAEFFKRAKYVVRLGPGTKDGGVDVRVWPAGASSAGPPLLLIQCKRYQKGKLVTVEYVKSLWSDVEFEEAERGLIATTARVSPEGKRVCEARKYPLSFAENDRVRKWARTMWRYALKRRIRTVGVGRYLLPPVVVLPARSIPDRQISRPTGKRR